MTNLSYMPLNSINIYYHPVYNPNLRNNNLSAGDAELEENDHDEIHIELSHRAESNQSIENSEDAVASESEDNAQPCAETLDDSSMPVMPDYHLDKHLLLTLKRAPNESYTDLVGHLLEDIMELEPTINLFEHDTSLVAMSKLLTYSSKLRQAMTELKELRHRDRTIVRKRTPRERKEVAYLSGIAKRMLTCMNCLKSNGISDFSDLFEELGLLIRLCNTGYVTTYTPAQIIMHMHNHLGLGGI